MKKNNICIAVIILAAVAYMSAVIYVNQKYPKAELEEKQLGETLIMDGIEITATNVEFMNQESFSEIYAYEKETFKEAECIMVTVTIKNTSEERQRITLDSFALTSGAWTNSVGADKYMAVNEKFNSEQYKSGPIYIEAGCERKIILPFLLVKDNFTKKQWEHVKERNYELVLSLYPKKQQIKL